MGFTSWSSENATKAYITTLKMERKEKEPNSAEFISALAAGNNAQVMVAAFAEKLALNNLLALVAAAHQTGGSVTCILLNNDQLQEAKHGLGPEAAESISFVIGNASELLLQNTYKGSDFLLIDCNINNYESIMTQIDQGSGSGSGLGSGLGLVVGFNALSHEGSGWQWSGLRTHLLPIGDGLLVTRLEDRSLVGKEVRRAKSSVVRKKSNWVVKVDEFTGEEHVFRVRGSSSQRKLEVAI